MDLNEDPLLINDNEKQNTLSISASFPNGTVKTYQFDRFATVQNLIEQIQQDTTVEIPPEKAVAAIYRGKFLKSNEKFSEIDNYPEYTVLITFRNMDSQHQNEGDEVHDLKGFDRLARMDYTPQQIEVIRQTFHQMRGSENDSPQQKIDAEEEWLPVIFNTDNPLEAFQTYNLSENRNERDIHELEQDLYKYVPHVLFALIFGFPALIIALMYNDNPLIRDIIICSIVLHYIISLLFF